MPAIAERKTTVRDVAARATIFSVLLSILVSFIGLAFLGGKMYQEQVGIERRTAAAEINISTIVSSVKELVKEISDLRREIAELRTVIREMRTDAGGA